MSILKELSKFVLTPKKIRLLAENKYITEEKDLEEGFEKAGKRADLTSWQKFIGFNLLLLSVLLLLSGVIFFVAANWKELDAFWKLGLLVLSVVLMAIIGAFLGTETTSGKMSFLLSCLLIGPTLALFGQIYQTGADSYQLFLGWALLIAPFLFLVYFSGLLFFWIFLFNLAFLAWSSVFLPFDRLLYHHLILIWPLANLLILIAWEMGYYYKVKLTNGRIFARLTSFLFFIPTIISSIFLIFFERENFNSSFNNEANIDIRFMIAAFVLLIATIAAMLFIYSKLIPDLFMASLAIFCAGLLVCFLFGRLVFMEMQLDAIGILFQGIVILLVTMFCIKAILKVQKNIENAKKNRLRSEIETV